jgi:predicted Zn-dependent peptidase
MQLHNVNGFNVAHKEFGYGDIMNARIIVNAGASRELDPKIYGVAHYLEHMFFKGTEKRNYKEINRITSELGKTNAYTSTNRTVYYLSFLQQDIEKALSVLIEMLFEPAFPEEEFEKERTVILEEAKMGRDNPSSYFWKESYKAIYGACGHPTIGSTESVEGMYLADLVNFRSAQYKPNNMLISVVGGKEIDVLRVLSDKLPESKPESEFDFVDEDTRNYVDNVHLHHEAEQAILCLAYPGYGERENTATRYVSGLTASCLGGGMHSLFFDRLREELGLCYSTFSYADQRNKYFGSILNAIYLDESKVDEAKDEMFKIIAKVKSEGVPQEILDVSRKNCLFSVAANLESKSGYGSLVADQYFDHDKAFFTYEECKKSFESITNEDIIRCVNELFADDPKEILMTQKK